MTAQLTASHSPTQAAWCGWVVWARQVTSLKWAGRRWGHPAETQQLAGDTCLHLSAPLAQLWWLVPTVPPKLEACGPSARGGV